jgi:tetraacyldisaccharide 4'-kinase
LIPAQIFREPLSSLKRANILVINHAEQAAGLNEFKSETKKKSPHLKIFTSGYKIKKFCDLRDNIVNSGDFSGRPTAALTAIGYPDGFFQMLSKEGVKVAKKITYPDHYELSEKEFEKIQNELADEGINDIIITRKDKYHLPGLPPGKIRVIVMDIEMIIEDSENFLREVENCLIK